MKYGPRQRLKWWLARNRPRRCGVCKRDLDQLGQMYALRDDVWLAANHGVFEGNLCLRCVEERLGRRLTRADFPDLPINDPDNLHWGTRNVHLVAILRGEERS